MSLVDIANRNAAEEAKNIVSLGFAMLRIINDVKEMDPSYANFNMRIGVHTVNL